MTDQKRHPAKAHSRKLHTVQWPQLWVHPMSVDMGAGGGRGEGCLGGGGVMYDQALGISWVPMANGFFSFASSSENVWLT